MNAILIWATGGMFGLIGLFGLIISSGAHSQSTYWIGLAVFVLSIIGIFYLISRDDDHASDETGDGGH